MELIPVLQVRLCRTARSLGCEKPPLDNLPDAKQAVALCRQGSVRESVDNSRGNDGQRVKTLLKRS